MLKLIEGGFFSGAREKIYSLIEAGVRQGSRSFLIVPEQQTVLTEGHLTKLLPPSAPLYFEATNFTRFSDTVFRSLGGLAGDFADKCHKSLIMWRALGEIAPFSEGEMRSQESAGTVKRYLSTVSQMKKLSVTPKELEDGAKRLEALGQKSNERLKGKLSDLGMVMLLYKKLLEERFSDSEDLLTSVSEKLTANGESVLSDTEIYIEGFTSFTEPQIAVITALLRICPVTVSLNLPRGCRDAVEFKEISDTRERLILCAAKAGVEVTVERLGDNEIYHAPLLMEACKHLWRTGTVLDEDSLCDLSPLNVLEAKTPYDECDFIAQDIRRQVMSGARYSDFGIIARDVKSYSGIIESSFERADVPIFISTRPEVDSYEAVKLIFSALNAAAGGFSRKDVIAYSKCSLCGVARDLCDEFEIYCDLWQLDGERFTEDAVWHMNPEGYSDRRDKGCEEKLFRIDRTRRALIGPLMRLRDELEGNAASHAKGLWKFLCELGVEAQLIKIADDLKRRGFAEQAQDIKQLWRAVISSLDGICEIMGDAPISPDSFINMLKITLSEADVGRIPSFTDRVTVSSADTARLYEKKHIYIIGANYGIFPSVISEDGYFTEKDRKTLYELGLPIRPESEIRSSKELYFVSRSFSYAKEKLTVIYHAKDGSYKDSQPSEIITRLSDLTLGRITPKKISDIPMKDKTYHKDFALENIGSYKEDSEAAKDALRCVGESERLSISEMDIKNVDLRLNKSAAKRLCEDKPLALTQSRIDSFVGCPMRYFCTFDLKLCPTERAEFDASNIGTFIHELLEKFFGEVNRRKINPGEISSEEKNALIKDAALGFAERFFEGIPKRSQRLQVTIDKLCRSAVPVIDGLCEEFAGCKFSPAFFELPIDKKGGDHPEPAVFKASDGTEVFIYGVIDRVDTYCENGDVYVRVVDYKTGSKEFSPKDLDKGENLQMFLYLKALVETKNPAFRKKLGLSEGKTAIPAGVIYVKTDIGDGKLNAPNGSAKASVLQKQKRLGMILDDDTSIAAMNKNYLPISLDKKTGEPMTEGSKFVYSTEGWDALNDKIADSVKKVADRMLAGDISSSGSEDKDRDACKWCDFKSFCRNSR